jgi:hypothetical protein
MTETTENQVSEASSLLDKVLHGAFVAALVLIAVVTGAVLTTADVFPGPQIARAYHGGKAYYDKLTAYQDIYASDPWWPARSPERGVTGHDPSRAQAGVTLYTSGHEAAAFLIDMDGEILHEWHRPFSTVWNSSAAVQDPRPDSHVFFRKAMVYPNGDLLAIYEGVGDTPYGYGMVKLDRNSEVIWSYLANAHHDFDIGPDGRIYLLTHEFVDQPLKGYEVLASPRLDDFLVVLSPDGEELKKIPLLHVVIASKYQHMLHTVAPVALADPLHTNTVDVITPEVADNFAVGKAGQILLSFRELGALGVLDVDSEQLVWAVRAYWLGQHDPDVLPNGNILLFDNFGNYDGPEGRSRVIEFDPETMEIVWQYRGNSELPLESSIRSSQQRLANGNTLITESNAARIFEVTPEGDIVWQFVNPIRGGRLNDRVPIICWGQRLAPDVLEPAVLARDRTPAAGRAALAPAGDDRG